MTPDNIREFKRCYGTTLDFTLAEQFSISVSEVRRMAVQLCLGKDKKSFPIERMPRWTAEEVETLKSLYGYSGNAEVARKLNRTIKSVVAKAHNLGLKKHADRLQEMGRQNVKLRRDRQ